MSKQESIEIKTSKEKFFLEYLILKKPIIDAILTRINGEKTTLSEVPMKVLAQLLYYNDMYKDLSEEDRLKKVFSKETKDQICEALDMKEHLINIHISSLRKIQVLLKKTINRPFLVYANDEHSLNFKFSINGHTQ